MGRWIAFDEESTAAAAAQTQMAVSFQRGDALGSALSTRRDAIVLLPGPGANDVLVLQIRRDAVAPIAPRSTTTTTEPSDVPVGYQASGFLGLVDEPLFEQEARPKKTWWRKLLD